MCVPPIGPRSFFEISQDGKSSKNVKPTKVRDTESAAETIKKIDTCFLIKKKELFKHPDP